MARLFSAISIYGSSSSIITTRKLSLNKSIRFHERGKIAIVIKSPLPLSKIRTRGGQKNTSRDEAVVHLGRYQLEYR